LILALKENIYHRYHRKYGFFSSLSISKGRLSSLKLFIFIATVALFFSGALAQAPKAPQAAQKPSGPFKVALLPVTIHSPENLEYMREGLYAMFSSRVELEGRVMVMERAAVKKAVSQFPGEIDSEAAQKIGETLGADFVVFGSMTKLGDSASVDLKVVDVKGEKPASSVYVQARKMEEIIAQVDVIARRVDEKILGYSIGPAVAERPAEPPRQAGAVPPPVFAPPPSPAAPPSSSASLPPVFGSPLGPRTEKAFSAADFSQSKTFPFVMRGIAMGDMDGDGKNEIAIIDEKNLYIYRWENNEFRQLKKFTGKANDVFMSVDAADVNKDGKAEIFVSNFPADIYQPGSRLFSFVVAFKDGDFRIVASDLDWFLTSVEWEGKGRILLGQKKGVNKSFDGPIYEIGWDGQKYKDLRKADIPRNVYSLYGFTPFRHGDQTYFAFIDSDFRLKVLDSKGKQIFRSSDYYGSDMAFLIKPLATIGPYQGDEFSFVNVRLMARGDEIIVIQNLSPIGNFFKRQKVFSGGEVEAMVWVGATFVETWKSKKVDGYLVDFQIQDFDTVPGKELIVAVNLPSETFLSTGASSALMVSRVQ
jgi:TolB-like protein